jgi:hypothetical protein
MIVFDQDRPTGELQRARGAALGAQGCEGSAQAAGRVRLSPTRVGVADLQGARRRDERCSDPSAKARSLRAVGPSRARKRRRGVAAALHRDGRRAAAASKGRRSRAPGAGPLGHNLHAHRLNHEQGALTNQPLGVTGISTDARREPAHWLMAPSRLAAQVGPGERGFHN